MARDGRGWHGDTPGHKEAALKAGARSAMNTPMKRISEKPTVRKITIRRRTDDSPDLSWLKDTQDETKWGKGWTQENIKKIIKQYGTAYNADKHYAMEDKKRLESYGESWYMIGIDAVAEIAVPTGFNTTITQHINSGGLWGIESDSGEEYIREVENEQVSELKSILKKMKIKIPTNVEIIHKEE